MKHRLLFGLRERLAVQVGLMHQGLRIGQQRLLLQHLGQPLTALGTFIFQQVQSPELVHRGMLSLEVFQHAPGLLFLAELDGRLRVRLGHQGKRSRLDLGQPVPGFQGQGRLQRPQLSTPQHHPRPGGVGVDLRGRLKRFKRPLVVAGQFRFGGQFAPMMGHALGE